VADKIFESFLERQLRDGVALAEASDLVKVIPLDPQHYLTGFSCKGFVKTPSGTIEVAERFEAGIYFGPDHLRRIDPPSVVTWFGPPNVWHPNISSEHRTVCIGNMSAGVGLTELIYQLAEIITWRRLTMHHSLNWAAAQWARNNRHLYPIDTRPLRRRALTLKFGKTEVRA
jgi:hypothetical protein